MTTYNVDYMNREPVDCPDYGKPCTLPSCMLMRVCRFKVFSPVSKEQVVEIILKPKKTET